MQPALQLEPPAGVVDLWLRPVGADEPASEQWLAPDERERARRFVNPEARVLFVLGRSLLRAALSTYLDCAPHTLRLDQRCARCGDQHGKPRLVDPASDLAFNLSHARGLIALAVGRQREVGIDVEWRGRAATMPELIPLLLSQTELQALQKIPDVRRPEVLLECWVRKEALLKATGEGLGRDLREVTLPLVHPGPAVYQHDGIQWGVCGLDLGPEHTGAVAAQADIPLLRRRSLARLQLPERTAQRPGRDHTLTR
jgi:4'-phosphopantetheinyl transferase